ncbi:MAG: amidohydrolase [Bacteroidales bacterium]|nr:amidohydrolase [Bacteroidales bacterium]
MPEVLTKSLLSEIKKLRKTLHQYPELSGKEKNTALRLKAYLQEQNPDILIERIGGYGLAAVFESGNKGPSLLFRADMDALPIEESNTFAHRSKNKGVAHKCGHDGHMAMLAGFASILRKQRPQQGRVILLFQPEEETGQGAAKVLADPQLSTFKPDYVFAIHNLPGFKKKSVVIREGPFASASTGMIIKLNGKSSHAAHPEQGQSPVHMMLELMQSLLAIPEQSDSFRDFVLVTIIHARLGEVAFGTNPGKATVMATLRTYLNDDMDSLKRIAADLVKNLEGRYGIPCEISYTEEFPATVNHSDACALVNKAVSKAGAETLLIEKAFRWSEDFGHFTQKFRGCLFGIGAGTAHPSLHNHDYDFPDELTETGISMFYHLAAPLVKLENYV